MSLPSAKMVQLLAVFCISSGLLVLGAPSSKCPPGGKYLDKFVGQRGRWQCCAEICEPLVWRDLCRRNCPDYQSSSVIKVPIKPLQTGDPLPPDPSANYDPAYAVLAVAAVLVVTVVSVVVKRKGWLDRASRICTPPHRRAGQEGGDVDNRGHLLLQEMPAKASPDNGQNPLTDDLAGERAEGRSRASGQAEPAVRLPPTQSQHPGQRGDYFQTAKEEGAPSVQPVDSTSDLDIEHDEN